ncbi:unnamed protein product [Blepharisma stoltei]|uniref:Uncharacterized protein n=1 Tax=Blepharisma stoltei TaxID=1481888 RepID=A0AAU9IBP9_9CILI|nr:unnamed protein product [Blepharisma stoltei]
MDNSTLPHEVQQCAPELARILSNKKNLYEFFEDHMKRYLPDYSLIDLNYLIQLLSGEKKTISQAESDLIKIEENILVSSNKLHQHCLNNPKLKFYVPEGPTNRDYVIKILAALDRDTFNKLKEVSAAKVRAKGLLRRKDLMITICGEFAKILLKLPITDRTTSFTIKPKPSEVENNPNVQTNNVRGKNGRWIAQEDLDEIERLEKEFGEESEEEDEDGKKKKGGSANKKSKV